MIAIRDLPHVLAVINAATIVVLLRAYYLIRARDREGRHGAERDQHLAREARDARPLAPEPQIG